MADKHEVIVRNVITSFSVERRGRLYMMQQGTFRALYSDAIIRISPYPKKQKGFPDLVGLEFMTYYVYKNYQYKEIRVPVYCVIEVKTKNDTLKPDQINYLNYAVSIGARAYVAMEDDSPEGYNLTEWVVV